MNILKTVFLILLVGFLLYVYVKYLPGWVEKFQEAVLDQPVKKEEPKDREEDRSYYQADRHKEDKSKKHEQKAEEEIKKILGIKKQEEEQKEETVIDKIKNYIKMLKSKLFQE